MIKKLNNKTVFMMRSNLAKILVLGALFGMSRLAFAKEAECCPPAVKPDLCCNGTTYNPSVSSNASYNLSFGGASTKLTGKINGNGCEATIGQNTASVTATKSEKCCTISDGVRGVRLVSTLEGSFDIDLGKVKCSYNFTNAVPEKVGTLSGFVSAGFTLKAKDFSFDVGCGTQSNACITLTGITFTVSGGLEAKGINNWIECCVEAVGTGSGSIQICYSEEKGAWLGEPSFGGKIKAVITISSNNINWITVEKELWSSS